MWVVAEKNRKANAVVEYNHHQNTSSTELHEAGRAGEGKNTLTGGFLYKTQTPFPGDRVKTIQGLTELVRGQRFPSEEGFHIPTCFHAAKMETLQSFPMLFSASTCKNQEIYIYMMHFEATQRCG